MKNLALKRELDKFSIFLIYFDDSKCMFVNKSKVCDSILNIKDFFINEGQMICVEMNGKFRISK